MIVLPMAGLSSRFFKAGYTQPKYMLPLAGRSVFDHAISSFSGIWGQHVIVIICRSVYDTPAFVKAECQALGLSDEQVKLVVLREETEGQAETVAAGLAQSGLDLSEPLYIFNIDTFRPGFRPPKIFDLDNIDGYVEVFEGEGDHWSFVRPDPDAAGSQCAAEVAEKKRISNLCSTGLYYFRSAELFTDLYEATAGKPAADLQGGERYVAPLYNDAIEAGKDIRYNLISPADVQFCGTPGEYEALLQQHQ